MRRHILFLATSASFALVGGIAFSLAQTAPTNSIPVKTIVVDGKQVQAPDWEQIAFDSLPPATEGGAVKIPAEIITQLGYNTSRTWQAGDKPAKFIMLGDVASAFGLEQFTLEQISKLTGIPLERYNLGDFKTIEWQTAKSLVKAIPNLENTLLADVSPLSDLFKVYGVSPSATVGDAIRIAPQAAEKLLGDEINLAQYKIEDIPGMKNVPIEEYAQWEKTFVNGVPSLADVSFSDFPVPLPGIIRQIALANVSFSDAERASPAAVSLTISGSGEPKTGLITLPVPPDSGQSYVYLELSDVAGKFGLAYGKRWVAGSSQDVPGGYGLLKTVNNGKEPTGMMVYGPPFKVVLSRTDESKGSAQFGLYFRHCQRTPFFDFGCTPYFIGPVPWIPVHETEALIVTASPR